MKTLSLKPVLFAAAAALALSACATATPYQPAGYNGVRGGYAEQRIENDRYRVSFAGNSVTSREQVEMSLLLRAAEVTLENGGDWFTTVERVTDRDVRYQATLDPWYGGTYGPYWGPSWRYYRGGAWGPWGVHSPYGYGYGYRGYGDVRQIDRFEATTEILVGRGPKPAGDANAFDAREVVQNIGPRLPRPPAG